MLARSLHDAWAGNRRSFTSVGEPSAWMCAERRLGVWLRSYTPAVESSAETLSKSGVIVHAVTSRTHAGSLGSLTRGPHQLECLQQEGPLSAPLQPTDSAGSQGALSSYEQCSWEDGHGGALSSGGCAQPKGLASGGRSSGDCRQGGVV